MELHIKAISNQGNSMETVFSTTVMEISTKDLLKMEAMMD
jgi:hypothetical protein